MSQTVNKGIKNTGAFGKKKRQQKTHRKNMRKDIIYADPSEGTYYGYVTGRLGNRRFGVRVVMIGGNIQTYNCSSMGSLSRHRIYINEHDFVLINNVVGNTYQIVQKFDSEQVGQLESKGEIDAGLLRGDKDNEYGRIFKQKMIYADENKGVFYGKIVKLINSTTYTVNIIYDDVFNENIKKCDTIEATLSSRLSRIKQVLQLENVILITKLAKRMYQITYVYQNDMIDTLVDENVFEHTDFDSKEIKDDVMEDVIFNCRAKSNPHSKVIIRDEMVEDAFANIMDGI